MSDESKYTGDGGGSDYEADVKDDVKEDMKEETVHEDYAYDYMDFESVPPYDVNVNVDPRDFDKLVHYSDYSVDSGDIKIKRKLYVKDEDEPMPQRGCFKRGYYATMSNRNFHQYRTARYDPYGAGTSRSTEIETIVVSDSSSPEEPKEKKLKMEETNDSDEDGASTSRGTALDVKDRKIDVVEEKIDERSSQGTALKPEVPKTKDELSSSQGTALKPEVPETKDELSSSQGTALKPEVPKTKDELSSSEGTALKPEVPETKDELSSSQGTALKPEVPKTKDELSSSQGTALKPEVPETKDELSSSQGTTLEPKVPKTINIKEDIKDELCSSRATTQDSAEHKPIDVAEHQTLAPITSRTSASDPEVYEVIDITDYKTDDSSSNSQDTAPEPEEPKTKDVVEDKAGEPSGSKGLPRLRAFDMIDITEEDENDEPEAQGEPAIKIKKGFTERFLQSPPEDDTSK